MQSWKCKTQSQRQKHSKPGGNVQEASMCSRSNTPFVTVAFLFSIYFHSYLDYYIRTFLFRNKEHWHLLLEFTY